MVKTTHTMIFPTTVSSCNFIVSEQDKNNIFNVILDNLNQDGYTMDYLGYVALHHDLRLKKFYTKIIEVFKDHLLFLNIDINTLDIYIIKSWFNLTDKDRVNTKHDHAEAHYSFTFYPHISEQSKKYFRVYRDIHPNEFHPGVFSTVCTKWDLQNALSWSFLPQEGDIFIFPAKTLHDTTSLDFGAKDESNTRISSIDDIKTCRVCISGDIIITAKNKTSNHRLLQPLSMWKNF